MSINDSMRSYQLPVASAQETWRYVLKIMKDHKGGLAALVVLHVFAIGAGVFSPILFGWLIDTLTDVAVPVRLNVWVLFSILCVVLAMQAFLTWCAQRTSWRFGENIFMRLRNDVIDGVTRLPLIVVEQAGRGDVIARTTNDIDAVSEAVRIGLPESLVAVLYLVFAAASSFLLDWRIAFISLVGLPLLFLVTRWYVKRSQHAYEEELRSHGRFDSISSESIESARTVDLLNDSKRIMDALGEGAYDVSKAERYTLSLQQWWFPAVQLGYYLPFALVAIVGGAMVLNDQANIGIVVAIAMNTQLVVDPMDDLLYWTDQLQLAWAAMRRMAGVSTTKSAISLDGSEDTENCIQDTSDGCMVTVDSLYVEYEKGNPVIKDVSIRIMPGESIALVGPSGAGKTTLALALCGLIPPAGGYVSISYLSPKLYGRQPRVMFVAQESHIFSGTLRFNLHLINSSADDVAIRNALMLVDASEYSSHLDDNVNDLDLGSVDKQKIALARVVLENPDFVVLDEAMSTFSYEEIARTETMFRKVLKGKTVIMIAHRLQTAMRCNRIVLLDHHHIVEQGSPYELLASDSDFAKYIKQ